MHVSFFLNYRTVRYTLCRNGIDTYNRTAPHVKSNNFSRNIVDVKVFGGG